MGEASAGRCRDRSSLHSFDPPIRRGLPFRRDQPVTFAVAIFDSNPAAITFTATPVAVTEAGIAQAGSLGTYDE